MSQYLFAAFRSLLDRLEMDESGQTAVEYGLVISLIAVVLVVALATGLTTDINTLVTKIGSKF